MTASFGPAGNPDEFYADGYRASVDMPKWLSVRGLDAYEYQCSRGVAIGQATAAAIGEAAAAHGVKLSIHAPYYINLATEDPSVAANTRRHLIKTVLAARWMGADRVVFHIGGIGRNSRQAAMELARRAFAAVLDTLAAEGHDSVCLLPETHGKVNQLGTVEEVISLCRMDPRVIPAIDFGHLHAVSGGRYTAAEEIDGVFGVIGDALGSAVLESLHIHFSKIEFTKGGEKRHVTFDDPFGPPFLPLAEAAVRRGLKPRFICESAGTQGKDALAMKELFMGQELSAQ